MSIPVAVVAVRRRISSMADGANVYLSVLLDELGAAGFATVIVFAPESSFGALPAAATAPEVRARCAGIVWSRALRLGRFAVSLSPLVWRRFFMRLLREAASLNGPARDKRPSRPSEPLDAREARALAARIDALSPRIVIAEYSALGPVLTHLRAPGAARAILLHDLFSLRTEALRSRAAPADVIEMTLEEEAACCAPAELLIYASETERETMAALLPGRRHVWMAPKRPMGEGAPPTGGERPFAVFLGVRHGGNLDALAWLMTEIWPRVIEMAPAAELRVVGGICAAMRPDWRRLPGVTAMGVVEDLATIGGPDSIGLAPARVASGISIKVADYLSLGMAVVASPTAVEGYGGRLDGVVELASEAEEFAARLVALLAAPERRRALSAKGLASTHFHLAETELSAALREISGRAVSDNR